MYTGFPLLPGISPGRSRGINTESKTERTAAECHLLHQQLSKQELEIKMVFLQSLLFYNLRLPLWHSGHLANASSGFCRGSRPKSRPACQQASCCTRPLGRLVFVLKDRDMVELNTVSPLGKHTCSFFNVRAKYIHHLRMRRG